MDVQDIISSLALLSSAELRQVRTSVERLLSEPANFDMDEDVQLVCHEDKTDRLLASLAAHDLDLVLADAPLTASSRVRAFNHLLGECGLTFFAVRDLARVCRRRFPQSLTAAPMLLPTENTLLRRSLDAWFGRLGIYPNVIAEFEDSALLKVFGEHGAGVFAAPRIVEREIRETYNVAVVGRTEDVRERFYAITVERRINHPAAVVISEHARKQLFDFRELDGRPLK